MLSLWLCNNRHCSLAVISNSICVSELVTLQLGLAYTTPSSPLLPFQLKDYHRRYPSDVEDPMQMEFLKLDKEKENWPEELQSMYAPICLFVSVCLSVCRYSLCVREHVPVHTSTLVPPAPYIPTHTHTPHTLPPSQILWTLQMKRGMISTWISINATTAETLGGKSTRVRVLCSN